MVKKSLIMAILIVGAVVWTQGVGAGEAQPTETLYPHLEEVIVVYKTHFDIGYSALARDVIHEYAYRPLYRHAPGVVDVGHDARERMAVGRAHVLRAEVAARNNVAVRQDQQRADVPVRARSQRFL